MLEWSDSRRNCAAGNQLQPPTKMHPTKKILLLTGICCSLTNCSTLFTGTSSNVQINSHPAGARVQVDGIDRGYTPTSVKLKKGSSGQSVTLQSKGYETKTFQPQTTMNPVSVLNLFNLLFWGVDAASGALWKYDPNYYDVKLDRSGSR